MTRRLRRGACTAPSLGPALLPTLGPALVSAALCLSGCAVGPDFRRPAPPPESVLVVPTIAAVGDVVPQQLDLRGDVPAAWWRLFGSTALDALVERALEHGADVASAQAALRSAEETALAQQGVAWPQVDASFSSTRQLVSNALSSPVSNNHYSFNLHTAQLDVSYVPDVFGGNRRLVESLQAQAEVQRHQLQATRMTLATNVVLAAVQQATLQAQADATAELLRTESEQLALVQRQVRAGAATPVDVSGQQAVIAQTEATLPALQKSAAQQQNQLAALLGELSVQSLGPPISLDALHLPQTLPLSLPSALVDQRPDIRAAEAQLHAASARVGVATADRLPSITLGLQAGGSAAVLSSLFAHGNTFATLGGTLAAPIVHGGTLLHRERAAEADLAQAEAQYRGVVIAAFQNVADALQAIDIDARGLASARRYARASDAGLAAVRRRMAAGDASRVEMVGAQQLVQQARLGLVQAEGSRLADTAALLQALGGGWWNGGPPSGTDTAR